MAEPSRRQEKRSARRDVGLDADAIPDHRTNEALTNLTTPREAVAGAPPVPLTGSVRTVRDRPGELSSFEVARSLWDDHEVYVGREVALRLLDHVPTGAPRRTGAQWVSTVAAMIDPDALAQITDPDERVLHGQLLIYGLTRYDTQLGEVLAGGGVLDTLRHSITPDPDALFRQARDPGRQRPPASQDVKLVADTPATHDLLDREGFANSLAALIDFQRGETRDVVSGPILVHLYGAWGSGKTSLFGLLRQSLESPSNCLALHDKGWLCVTFNAWGHQRTAPPWWWLMDRVYREARTGKRDAGLAPLPWFHRLRLWAWWWGLALLALMAAAALLASALVFGIVTIDRMAGAKDAVSVVVGFFVAAGSAVALARSSKSSLLVGSPRAANALLRSGGDPYRRIRNRYTKLVRKIGRNVLVFIDDLDRCQPDYVVELLEGVQTIFSDAPVTYLVAADREWVSESFQKVYADLGPTMDRPGRQLGYLFLEKTFAVSAPLPRPSSAAQQRYWSAVLSGGAVGMQSITESDRAMAKAELADVSPEDALARAATLASTDLSGGARALREKAAIKMAEAVTSGEQDHVLAPYLSLLDQNPRALKRLRNAYAIAAIGRFASLDISTAAEEMDALVRWTILGLRWPQLACRVMEQPRLLHDVQHAETTALGEKLADLAGDDDLGRLLREPVGGVIPDLEHWVAAEIESNLARTAVSLSADGDGPHDGKHPPP